VVSKAVKPRLLIFSKLFWPEGGGAELATYTIVGDILSKYFDVTVVSGTDKPGSGVSRICRYMYWGLLRAGYKPLEWIEIFANMDYVKKLIEGVDIVYIPSHTLIPLAIIVKKLKPNVKIVIHLHNYQPLTYTSVVLSGREPDLATDIIIERWEHNSIARAIATGLLGSLNKVNALALRAADRIICVSWRQAEIISNLAPELAYKIKVVYNPPQKISPIGKKIEDPAFLYLGGDSYIKGFHIFLGASQKLLKRDLKASFMLAGSYKDSDRRIIGGLGKNYSLLGYISHEEVLKFYSHSIALLFPSVCEEPLPYAVLEAMLAKTIPIASRVGGVPEIVKGTYAEKTMFAPANFNEMADKMEEVLSLSRDQLVGIGCELREATLKRFDEETIKQQLLKVFEA
jgi:glycosyltransferase involved in cell wall biosynthesis